MAAGSRTASDSAFEGVYVFNTNELTAKVANVVRFNDVTLPDVGFETEVELFVVGGPEVLIDVARNGAGTGQKVVAYERSLHDTAAESFAHPSSASAIASGVIHEERAVKADVLVDIVVEAVIPDAETATHDELAVTESVV